MIIVMVAFSLIVSLSNDAGGQFRFIDVPDFTSMQECEGYRKALVAQAVKIRDITFISRCGPANEPAVYDSFALPAPIEKPNA
jgi:hypothetical protein